MGGSRCRIFRVALGALAITWAGYVAAAADDAAKTRSADARPNVIFILADDLGYGDLGCYGQKRIKTPHLDRLASAGLRCTQFYAGSTVCAPSRCALMTGRHMGQAFIRGNGRQNLRPSDVTVAKVLRDAGYATGLVGKWGLGHEGSTGVPTRQGFDYFYGYLDQGHAHNHYPAFLMRGEERAALKNVVPGKGPFGSGVASDKQQYAGDLLADEAVAFVERSKDRPFFLFYAPVVPHANNEAGKLGMEVPELGEYADLDWPAPQKGHAAMITRLDRDIGRLLARLKVLGLDDNTLVMFSSDNGPHAEGGADPKFNNSSGGLRGHKRDLYEGGVRVPFIARWPAKIKPATSDLTFAFWDVLPTLAELGKAKLPEGLDASVSFAPTLLGRDDQKQPGPRYWAFFEGRGAQAIRDGRWKLVEQPHGTPPQLYDLEKDVGETKNLAAEQPDVVARLTKQMAAMYTPSDVWKFPVKKTTDATN